MDFEFLRFYFYRPAEAYMRFLKNEHLVTENRWKEKLPKLEMRLVEKHQDGNWLLGEWGILGLAPYGSFFTYLVQTYDESDSVSIALKYTFDKSNSSRFGLEAYLNPKADLHYSDSDVMGTFVQDTNSDSWFLNGSLRLPDTELNYDKQKMCFDSSVDEWFGVPDGIIWCQRVRQAVCGTSQVSLCTKKKAQMSRAPVIELMIEGKDFSMQPHDYIYFDNDRLQCRILEKFWTRQKTLCPPETRIVLGKMFMAKNIPIFTASTLGNQRSVTLVRFFISSGQQKLIWIILGILVFIISLSGLILTIICKKRIPNKEQYSQIQ